MPFRDHVRLLEERLDEERRQQWLNLSRWQRAWRMVRPLIVGAICFAILGSALHWATTLGLFGVSQFVDRFAAWIGSGDSRAMVLTLDAEGLAWALLMFLVFAIGVLVLTVRGTEWRADPLAAFKGYLRDIFTVLGIFTMGGVILAVDALRVPILGFIGFAFAVVFILATFIRDR